MTPEEAAAFESDPLKDAIIRMRTWDEAAKVEKPRFHVPTLESYRPMVERAIQRERERIEKKEFKHYKLTKEQTDGWRRDGFIKLTDLLSPDQKKQVSLKQIFLIRGRSHFPSSVKFLVDITQSTKKKSL